MPVPSAVVVWTGFGVVTPAVFMTLVNCHPAPAATAPVMLPAGAVLGTICLVTVKVPWQLPSARLRSACPAAG